MCNKCNKTTCHCSNITPCFYQGPPPRRLEFYRTNMWLGNQDCHIDATNCNQCVDIYDAKCVQFSSADQNCLNIKTDDNLDTIIKKTNSFGCAIIDEITNLPSDVIINNIPGLSFNRVKSQGGVITFTPVLDIAYIANLVCQYCEDDTMCPIITYSPGAINKTNFQLIIFSREPDSTYDISIDGGVTYLYTNMTDALVNITELTPNTTYSIVIRQNCSNTGVSLTTPYDVTTAAEDVPIACGPLTGMVITYENYNSATDEVDVVLTWDNLSNATSYTIFLTGSGNIGTTTSNTFTFTLPTSTIFDGYVHTTCDSGTDDTAFSGVTEVDSCVDPTGLTTTMDVSTGDVTLNWTPGGSTGTQKIYYKLSSDSIYTFITSYAGTVTTGTIPSLLPNTNYDFLVTNDCGTGIPASGYGSNLFFKCPVLTVNATGNTTIGWQFNEVGANITSYDVVLYATNGTTVLNTQVITASGTGNNRTGSFTGLTANTNYKVGITLHASSLNSTCNKTSINTNNSVLAPAPTSVLMYIDGAGSNYNIDSKFQVDNSVTTVDIDYVSLPGNTVCPGWTGLVPGVGHPSVASVTNPPYGIYVENNGNTCCRGTTFQRNCKIRVKLNNPSGTATYEYVPMEVSHLNGGNYFSGLTVDATKQWLRIDDPTHPTFTATSPSAGTVVITVNPGIYTFNTSTDTVYAYDYNVGGDNFTNNLTFTLTGQPSGPQLFAPTITFNNGVDAVQCIPKYITVL